jgi:nucleoid DNA-binding protein
MSEVAQVVADSMGVSQDEADEIVTLVCDAIGAVLAREGRVHLGGFGTFQVRQKPPTRKRNPRTGERVSVPGRRVPIFKAGGTLRTQVGAPPEEDDDEDEDE